MSARSLRSGIIKTGDSIQRATRRNTILFKTENGFQQARQIDKRPLASLMLTACSPPKRKRRDSPSKNKVLPDETKKDEDKSKDVTEQDKPENKKKFEQEENKDDEKNVETKTKQPANGQINSSKEIVPPKEVEHSMKRTPRMASLNAIVKVNAVLDSLSRADNRKKLLNSVVSGKTSKSQTHFTSISKGKKSSANSKECGSKDKNLSQQITKQDEKFKLNVKIKKEEVDDISANDLKNQPKQTNTKEGKKLLDCDNNLTKEKAKLVNNSSEKIKCTRKESTAPKKTKSLDEVHASKSAKYTKKVKKELAHKAISSRYNKTATKNSKELTKIKPKYKQDIQIIIKQENGDGIDEYDDDNDDETSESSDSDSEISLESMRLKIQKKKSDRCIQTDVNNKSIQTDLEHLPNSKNKRLCTCKLASDSSPSIPPYNPFNHDYKAKPIYVKSSVLAHTANHTLVVPIKKRHVLKEKENEYSEPCITNNISSLLDSCINNTLLQSNNTCSKLLYMSKFKEKTVLNSTNDTKKSTSGNSKNVNLKIPKVDFCSIQAQKNHGDKNMKNSTVHSSKKIKSPLGRQKKCNGWQFEGEPMEEPYTLGAQIITRRHYESVSRNKEVLHIHDAVLLKSGMKGVDYLARISMFWEDLTGPNSGELMMSIYWYYKPGQTSFKFPETSEMEVYASRHRDDNSVACIVEKCYVVSFTQFCRFQAQKMLLREKCKRKLKVVPEKHLQSRFLPSPDVDESIVFYCRYGYEHRCGKILKGL